MRGAGERGKSTPEDAEHGIRFAGNQFARASLEVRGFNMDLIVAAEQGTAADRSAWSLRGASIAFATFVRSWDAVGASPE
jgi:hypothetical protein